jgi:hypothetical protein
MPAIRRRPKNGLPEMPLLAIGQCISNEGLQRSRTGPNGLARPSILESSGTTVFRPGTHMVLGGWGRPWSLSGLEYSSSICFFPDHQRHRGVKPSRRFCPQKPSLFQHVWHCLIYSGVYLFQFARHVALLLKTSSALPAHHCIRQASRPQGWLPRAFLPFPSLPTAACTARADCTDGSLMIKLVGGPATVYALKGSPTSCQVVLQPSAVKRVARRDSPMHSNTVVVRGKGATLSTLVL